MWYNISMSGILEIVQTKFFTFYKAFCVKNALLNYLLDYY